MTPVASYDTNGLIKEDLDLSCDAEKTVNSLLSLGVFISAILAPLVKEDHQKTSRIQRVKGIVPNRVIIRSNGKIKIAYANMMAFKLNSIDSHE